MTKRKPKIVFPTRTAEQIRGVRSQLTVAINTSEDGAYAMVDLTTARNLQEICDQAAVGAIRLLFHKEPI